MVYYRIVIGGQNTKYALWCILNMPKFTRFLGGPNGPKICARRTKTDFKERACNIPECERKVFSLNFTFVLSSFGCSNLMGNVDCICSWKAKRNDELLSWEIYFFLPIWANAVNKPHCVGAAKRQQNKSKVGRKNLSKNVVRMQPECRQNVATI